jgi:hypothetical protein
VLTKGSIPEINGKNQLKKQKTKKSEKLKKEKIVKNDFFPSIDQQIDRFAEIISIQILKEINFYEKN